MASLKTTGSSMKPTGGSSKRSLTVVDAETKKTKAPAAKKVALKKPSKKRSAAKKAPKKARKVATKVRKTTAKKVPKSTSKAVSEQELSGLKREPLGHLLMEQHLREAGFHGGISTNKDLLDTYSTDESIFAVRPQIVIQPKHQRDVETAVTVIAKHTEKFPSLSLTPRAAGTGLSGGSLTDSIVVDVCAHMHAIGTITKTKEGATVVCEPGVMWRDVEKKLKAEGVYIPSFPASKDLCSIGGSVGNNAAGPDSLRFGHTASWVASLDVVLRDGNTYTVKPWTYKEFKALTKKKHALATIAKEIFSLIEKNEKEITNAKPKTKKNSAGYPLWDVLDGSVSQFKKGKIEFDLTRLISGSQGTIGIITSVTMKAVPIPENTELIAIPIFDLATAGAVVIESLKYDPINIEVFDALTFDLALKNPDFFKDRLSGSQYYRVLLSMYTTYHIKWRRKTPEFVLLVTIDPNTSGTHATEEIVRTIQSAGGKRARLVNSAVEKEMFWQIRRASYSLSKFQDPKKRPAAFLEDMTVPPKNLAPFFMEIKKLLKKFNVTAAVHGHGGNGHFHFYPLLDFTSDATAVMVEKMSEDFFNTAVKYEGNICGEHNDGIIRTPHLSKMFTKATLELFKDVEHIFDPDDIFNPGKKVNPRFDIKETLRKTN